MRYRGIVYFAGPRSRWQERVHEAEILFRTPEVPWRWLARRLTLGVFQSLDAAKCGYVVLDEGQAVEQYDPPIEEPVTPVHRPS